MFSFYFKNRSFTASRVPFFLSNWRDHFCGRAESKREQAAQLASIDHGNFLQRMLGGTKVTVGVNNAFDRNPPSVLGALNDHYDTSLYTIRNRYYYLAINKKF
jgi:hypothetical protein